MSFFYHFLLRILCDSSLILYPLPTHKLQPNTPLGLCLQLIFTLSIAKLRHRAHSSTCFEPLKLPTENAIDKGGNDGSYYLYTQCYYESFLFLFHVQTTEIQDNQSFNDLLNMNPDILESFCTLLYNWFTHMLINILYWVKTFIWTC